MEDWIEELIGMRRDDNGKRVVSAKIAAGWSIAAVASAFTLYTGAVRWLGFPSPAERRDTLTRIESRLDQCATKEDMKVVFDAINNLDRRASDTDELLEFFDITKTKIVERMRERTGG